MDDRVILIVEDSPPILALLADAFAREGYTPVTAASGQEALAGAARTRPGVILLDLQLPDRSGVDVAAALRARGIDAPIVVMTAAPDGPIGAAHLRAADFLPKPFDLEHVLASVERVRSTVS